MYHDIILWSRHIITVRLCNLLSRIHNQLTIRKELAVTLFKAPSITNSSWAVCLAPDFGNELSNHIRDDVYLVFLNAKLLMYYVKPPIGLIWVHNFLVTLMTLFYVMTLLWNFLVYHLKNILFTPSSLKLVYRLNGWRKLWKPGH